MCIINNVIQRFTTTLQDVNWRDEEEVLESMTLMMTMTIILQESEINLPTVTLKLAGTRILLRDRTQCAAVTTQ